MINTMENLPYRHFNQATKVLDQVQAIDYYLAQGLLDSLNALDKLKLLSNVQLEQLFHVFMALSKAQRDGHSCLEIELIDGKTLFTTDLIEQSQCLPQYQEIKPGYTFSSKTQIVKELNGLNLHAIDKNNPVIFENNKLYLRRYWNFEVELAEHIKQKINHKILTNTEQELLKQQSILQVLFPNTYDAPDWQMMAVANALNKSFTIIAGGPGTGKTYTVTKLLAGLLMQDNHANIRMVAPTGKAAQRLSESIVNAVSQFKAQNLIEDDILNAIPNQASTIHRLLGVIKNNPNFRHNEHKKLSCDVLLIDEVSMVDLPMMTRLFRALPAHCRVILLGDAQQLPSVATGSVLADLAPNQTTKYSLQNNKYLQTITGQNIESATGLSSAPNIDYLTYLTKSRRFDGEGGIGKVARLVINGAAAESWELLTNEKNNELTYIADKSLHDYIKELTKKYYKPIFDKGMTINDAFNHLNAFRILAPTRQGEFGLINLNELIEQTLRNLKCINTKGQHYKGKAIMISQNHYGVNLFNGDIGILWPSNQDANRLVAVFPDENGYREISMSRLPTYETVYAMTIHKTQGSEFKNVALILPTQGANRLLSRELIYTAITRAKSHLQIFCQQTTWHSGVKQKVDRASGLTSRLMAFLKTQQ